MPESRQTHVYDYAIDGEGNWFCEGNPVSDPALFKLLSRSLFAREGRYFIRCEGEVHPVRVSDAPLWVRYVHAQEDPDGNLLRMDIELFDGRREALAAETLTVAGDNALYCLATQRRLKARFARVAYYEIAGYFEMEESAAQFFLVLAGRTYPIRSETRTAAQSDSKT